MTQAVAQEAELTRRLIAALRRDEFLLYGQAIVPLGEHTDTASFQEILIRFQEEETKLLPPGSFLPILEECGLMPHVDRWVVSRVRRWQQLWQEANVGQAPPRCSLNLATETWVDPRFCRFVEQQLESSPAPASALAFEVTCSCAESDAPALAGFVRSLRALGCSFILARFDGGVRALEFLHSLQPHYVKFSPSLVRALGVSEKGAARMGELVAQCTCAGARTIAEHVESNQTLARLRRLGVNFAQGFGIQMPRPLL